MRKIVIVSITAIILSASTAFASVDQEEISYLFGTQETIEMQLISYAEMKTTEGQLFGISNDLLKGYLGSAYTYIKPIALEYANQLKDKLVIYLKGRIDSFLANQNTGV